MNYSISDGKVIKLGADNSLPLSPNDIQKMDAFFEQGTFNQKLDQVKDDAFLSLNDGGLLLLQQRTLSHLHSIQEKYELLKNGDESNDLFGAQVLNSIENDYEAFEQNFNILGEKFAEKELSNPSELDQENNNFLHELINSSKNIFQDVDNISKNENDSTLVNRFDIMVKSREELYENKVNQAVSEHTPLDNEKTFSFSPD